MVCHKRCPYLIRDMITLDLICFFKRDADVGRCLPHFIRMIDVLFTVSNHHPTKAHRGRGIKTAQILNLDTSGRCG